jgi:hypothetical protein
MVSEKHHPVSQAAAALEAVVELMPVRIYCYVCADSLEGTRSVHLDEDGHEVFTNLCPKQHRVSTGCVIHFAREGGVTACKLPIRPYGPRIYTAVASEIDCLECAKELASERLEVDWRPTTAIAEDHYAF